MSKEARELGADWTERVRKSAARCKVRRVPCRLLNRRDRLCTHSVAWGSNFGPTIYAR